MNKVTENNKVLINLDNVFQEYGDIVKLNDMIKMLKIGRNEAYKIINSNKVISFGNPHKILKSSIIDYIKEQIINNYYYQEYTKAEKSQCISIIDNKMASNL